MARPKKTVDKRKSAYFRFRLTEEEKRLIDEAAQAKSLDSSAWARSELLDLAKRISAARHKSSK